jgi:hypothetical protein
MVKRGVVPVHLEVAHVTRRQLDRAFGKLESVTARKAALEAQASHAAMSAYASVGEPEPVSFQLASAIATEITRPIATIGNIFKAYVESLIRPSGPHVNLTCPDGKPLPEKLRVVLRRAAWEFDGVVEVLSGYRSLSYNRGIYGHRCRGGTCRGDRSQHILCKAADFRIAGVSAAKLYSWALQQPELGGVGRYRNDFIHVDVRSRPAGRLITWAWRARKFARKHQPKRRYAKAVHSQPRG